MKIQIDATAKALVCVCHGRELTAQVAALPQATVDALLQYGFQRFINDRANQGGRDATTEHKHATAQAVLEQLLEGWVGRIAAPKAPVREKVATALLTRALGMKKWKALDADKQAIALARFIELHAAAIDAEIARREEERRRNAELMGGLDLGDLGGLDF